MTMPATLDNRDTRIRYYELVLQRPTLEGLPQYALPAGYRFAFFKPGDRDAWIAIEQSVGEVDDFAHGVSTWNRYYGGREDTLTDRMCFIETESGDKVATATAYADITGRDASGAGWLHWVAVRRDHQGRGLSKPLIAHTLGVMRALGYAHAKIPTQTTTWVACRIYLDFGFTPIPANAQHSRDGWRIIKTLTRHSALTDFPDMPWDEILTPAGEK